MALLVWGEWDVQPDKKDPRSAARRRVWGRDGRETVRANAKVKREKEREGTKREEDVKEARKDE